MIQGDTTRRRSAATSVRPGISLIFDLLRSQRWLLLLAASLATAAAIIELIPYWLIYRMAVEITAPAPELQLLIVLGVLILIVSITRVLVFGAANVASHAAAFRLQKDLRISLLRRLHRQPLGVIDGRTGDLKKTLVDDVGAIENLIAHTTPDAVAGLAMPVLAVVFLAFVDWRMTLASLALLPVAFIAQKRAFSGLGPIFARWHDAEGAANTGLLTYVRGIATLKAYHRTATSLAELRQSVHALGDLAAEVTRRTAIPYALMFVTLSSNLIIVLPVTIVLHTLGSLEASKLVLFALLGAGLTAPLLRGLHAFGVLQRQLQGAARIAEVLATSELARPRHPREPQGTDIIFDGVSFGYAGDRNVIHDLSFAIPQGRVTGLVGPSGAGKSTLMRLISRYWDIQIGSIRIGGADLREIEPERLRSLISVVFQDPFLFHGTLRENLEIAAPDATKSALTRAIDAAGLSATVAQLSHGLDTPIGDRGARLSGGERQRLAIARALLKDAPILLLDEATAFADPENELAIQEAIARLTAGRTVVVVAHRLVTVSRADQIAVLENGRLDGLGRHGNLIERSPVYRNLWQAQGRAAEWGLRRPDGVPS